MNAPYPDPAMGPFELVGIAEVEEAVEEAMVEVDEAFAVGIAADADALPDWTEDDAELTAELA